MPFEGERRIMVPSPKVATYDLKPEMSAYRSDATLAPGDRKAIRRFHLFELCQRRYGRAIQVSWRQ